MTFLKPLSSTEMQWKYHYMVKAKSECEKAKEKYFPLSSSVQAKHVRALDI